MDTDRPAPAPEPDTSPGAPVEGSAFDVNGVYGARYYETYTGGAYEYEGQWADFFGNVSFLRNQRQISRAGETDADVYTRRRALESGYNYFAGVGLRYTFGSIFTGVVNPRFGGDGGGGIVFFN